MKFKELREKYRSKFPASLVAAAVKIALDMGGNMTGAYKKIEKMKRGLGDDPMVKDALRLANESVEDMKEDKDIPFGYTFFDMGDVRKFTGLIKSLKGLELVSSEKMKGGQFIVRVKGPRKVVAKANALAIRVMSEFVTENISEVTISIDEKTRLKSGKGKGKADIDYIGSTDLSKKLEKKYKIKIKPTGQTMADVMGDKKNLLNFLSDYMMLDDEDIEDLYPEILS